MATGYSNKTVDQLIRNSQQFADRSRAASDFQQIQSTIAQDVPLVPLWQRKEYTVTTEDVGGGQYLMDGTGVYRLWRLDWI